ncbi:ABC-type dipeptide transport system, periplasmic component [Aciduliprofundum sp. MAR08-339]|uniref:ABC transporter substrate-binding protein n=1 Tax=Aciduliprofundum sp. (strain MAR08-339) TaxID=673860 RepID=UPI0002A4A802|nr:ABC-type dipeptide transport system, periplasmic component [Aciduliprofundum sp. MAR08-339]
MKKSAIYGIIAVVVIIIVVVAAWAVMTAPPSKTKPQVKNPDTFVWDTIGDPQTLDPAEAYDTASGVVIQNVYQTLVTYHGTDTKTIYPLLATHWTVDKTGKNWTFYLRKDVKFSNGDPFNATAVKFSFDRVLIMNSPQTGVSWILSQFMYTYNATAKKWNSPDGKSSVQVVGPYTVEFHLREAYGGFLPAIAFTVASIVDPKVVNAHGGVVPNKDNSWMSQNMVGTGPYKLVEWQHNAFIKLEWNPNYWGGWSGHHVKYIIIRNIPSLATREQELVKGDADMAYIPVNHLNDTILTNDKYIKIDTGGLTFDVDMIEMNCRKTYQNETNPLYYKEVRQAISYAVPYDTIIKEVYKGYAIRLQGPIPKGMPGHDNNLFMYPYDIKKAQQLMNDARQKYGLPQTIKLTILYNQGNAVRAHIAEILKGSLLNIGIQLTIQELSWPTLLDKMDRGDYSMIIVGWAPDYNDPDDYAFPFLGSAAIGGDTYETGWHNATVDKLLLEAKYCVNQTKREQLYYEIQKIAMEDPSFIYIAQNKHVAVYRTWLQGYYYNPVMMLNFYSLYKAYS